MTWGADDESLKMRHRALLKWKQNARLVASLVPLSSRGALVALFSGFALWRFGFGTLDLLLFVIGISGLALVALSSLVVGGSAIYLFRRQPSAARPSAARPDAARRLEAGSPILTGFRLPSLARLPLVKVHWQWLSPAGVDCRIRHQESELVEEVVASRRCQVAAIRRRITVFDVFGLSRVSWERQDPTPVTILPHVGCLRRMPIVQSMAAAEGVPHPMGSPDGDRMEIRRYVPGDSVRHILWKTYARTRQLNVRIPERSIERARKTVAYLLTGPEDEAAAAAARVALETGVFGHDWMFGADGTEQPTDQLEPALEAIARSGSIEGNGHPAAGDGGLSSFLSNPDVRSEVHCIVFAPCNRGRWTEEALLAARNFSGAISFVLGTDGIVHRQQTPPLWQRLLVTEDACPGTSLEELSELLQTMGSAGCSAVVVDRQSGRSYGPDRQRALGAPS